MRLGPISFPISADLSKKLFWAAVLLLAGTAAFPLLSGVGLLNTRGGGDSPFLLQRLYELTTALQDGHFPVRWMPNANYGYGYPFYNYYAPLSIYIAALFRFLGFSYVGTIKAAQLAGFLTAGGAMFVLGRRWFKSRWAGLLAAAAYTFAPFHMVNVYVRGDSLAEFWAMAFYPLVLITADNFLHNPKRPQTIARFALAYAALILSHNISALIFTPFLLLYLTLPLLRRRNHPQSTNLTQVSHQPINRLNSGKPSTNQPITQLQAASFTANYPITQQLSQFKTIALISLPLLLALALSAWFWLPAIAEQGLAQLGPVTAGYFHFSNHFRGADLTQGSLLFDYNVAGGLAFRMGLMQLMVIVAGSAVLLFTIIKNRRTTLFPTLLILPALLIATFMITPLSRPLWDNLPLLPFTQFPWRFLSIQAFFGALAAGGLALLPRRRLIAPLVILAIAVSGLGDLRTDHLYLTDDDITAERLAQYEWFTGNIGSTVSAEYLPAYVQPRPFTSPWLNAGNQAAVFNDVEAEPLSPEADKQNWQISTAAPTTVTLPLLDWPGWRAEIDGAAVDSQPAPGSGLLTLTVPSGEHTVELRLTRTPVRTAAEILSLTAVILIAFLFWPAIRQNADRQRLKWIAAVIVGLLLAAIGLRLWPTPTTSADTLSWDFEQLGYLHHSPDGIPFENGLLLRQYSYNQDAALPGEELTITLTWENGDGATADIALTTPAIQRVETAPILTAQSQTADSGQVSYQLTIPENAPAGLYVPRLTVDGAKSLTESGQARGDLFLRPIRILEQSQPANQTALPLDVWAVDVVYQSPDILLVQLQWLTMKPLTENYNVSLRLADNIGLVVAQQDAQPGFGYLPSSGWRPGQWENDWLTLPLPDDFSAERPPYALVAHLYNVETEAAVLTRRLGEMVLEGDTLAFQQASPLFTLPAGISPAFASFEETIQLRGYTLEQSADFLTLTLIWQALADSREDYFHFVHLIDPTTGDIVAQHDSMPRNNTYPTSQWRKDEIVPDMAQLPLEDIPPGEYLLYVGLYRNLGGAFPPLAATDETGRPLENNQLLLDRIVIEGKGN